MLHKFEDIFNKESFDALLERCQIYCKINVKCLVWENGQWDHAIKLNTDNPHLPRSKVYLMSLDKQAELDTFLDKALQTGCIRTSKSLIGAPVFFIEKKDGGLLFIQDYCVLNEITIKCGYPFPLIDDLIHQLCGAHYFTKLDVQCSVALTGSAASQLQQLQLRLADLTYSGQPQPTAGHSQLQSAAAGLQPVCS
jgi:hypothetical protein